MAATCVLVVLASLFVTAQGFGPGSTAISNSGVICSRTLQSYSGMYNISTLYFSEEELQKNVPQLEWDTPYLSAVTYTSGFGLITDLGDIDLEGLGADCATQNNLVYSQRVTPKVGHVYAVINNRPSFNDGYFAVKVTGITNGSIELDYGIFTASEASTKSDTMMRMVTGDAWQKLSKPQSGKECSMSIKHPTCMSNPGVKMTAKMAPAGKICGTTLSKYTGNMNVSALYFSDISQKTNAPQMYFDGDNFNAVSYSTGWGVVADLGKKTIEGMNSENFTDYNLQFSSQAPVVVGHSYAFVTLRPSTNGGLFAVEVVSMDASKQTVDIKYGIIQHSVDSTISDSTARVYVGDTWTTLKSDAPGTCGTLVDTPCQ
eukprot:m.334927 g.334927  ORF g.334927 m.334927 type:complete len:373 (+) comp17472_c0_seq1:84-1202(+)